MQNNSNLRTRLLIMLLFFFSFLSVKWVLSGLNTFTYDDFSTLVNSHFHSYEELFRFLPASTYNDRPIGLILIKCLNDIFDLNSLLFHYVFVFIHLINVLLLYKISLLIFNGNGNGNGNSSASNYAILTAGIFGIYPISLMPVSWTSAVFDITCAFFTLLSILFYLKARINIIYRPFYAILFLLFYYLSIRSKEMSLVLPIIIIIYEISKALEVKKRFKISWYLILSILFMLIYIVLLYIGGRDKILILPDSPYYQNFSVQVLFKDLIHYLFLYFDWTNSGFSFYSYSLSALPGVILFISIISYAFFLALKHKDFTLLLSIFTIGISLAPVLPMINMQHRLYLYIPSIFIGLSISIFILKIFSAVKKDLSWEFAVLLIPCLYLVSYSPGMVNYRQFWLTTTQKDDYAIQQLLKIDKPIKGTNIYIKGASNGYNIFYYGPGNSIKLMFNDNTLKSYLVKDFPKNPQKPYMFLEYQNDNISEIKYDSSAEEFKITSTYPSIISRNETKFNIDDSVAIGVSCTNINNNLQIFLNNKPMQTIIGKDFISTVIPKNELNKPFVQIIVKDKATGLQTQPWNVQIKN